MKPAYVNFDFRDDLEVAVSAFKFAQYFSPVKVVELQPTVSDLENLLVFPFVNPHIIDQLKLEFTEVFSCS